MSNSCYIDLVKLKVLPANKLETYCWLPWLLEKMEKFSSVSLGLQHCDGYLASLRAIFTR